jgi:hypothetical protein
VAGGLDPDRFWRSTPREIATHLDGARLRAEREHEARSWAVWHVAALARVEKLPKFGKFVSGGKAEPPRQKTPAEIEATLRAWLGPRQ